MNRQRLRGTWEDDPAPIPFPADRPINRPADRAAGSPAGRQAGSIESTGDAGFVDAPSTDDVIRNVEAELERASFKIDELRDMLTPFDRDPPPAA